MAEAAQYAQIASQFISSRPQETKKDDSNNSIVAQMAPTKVLKHGGMLFGNLVISLLLLIFISGFLFVSGILTAILASQLTVLKLDTTTDKDFDQPYATSAFLTITIWVNFIIAGLITLVGFWLIPWVFGAIPYIGAAFFILYGLFIFGLAMALFYIGFTISRTNFYKKEDKEARSAFKLALISGILTMLVSFLLIGYGIFVIIIYKRMGGLKSSLGVGLTAASIVAV